MSELADVTASDEIVAGFRVPERSVSTVPVADSIAAAVRAEPLIEVRTGVAVRAVRRRDDDRFDVIVDAANGEFARFDTVVNALWEGRPAVDATLGISPPLRGRTVFERRSMERPAHRRWPMRRCARGPSAT